MLNSQCVVMVLVANKEKINYNNNDLRVHCHHCKTTKTKQKLDRMLTSLKHYIVVLSQKKQKQNTWQQAWNLMPLMQHNFFSKKNKEWWWQALRSCDHTCNKENKHKTMTFQIKKTQKGHHKLIFNGTYNGGVPTR